MSARLRARAVVAALVGATAVMVLGGAGVAHADVTIQPPAVAPGSLVPFTLQVANDRAPEATTRVELAFPDSPAIAWAEVVPVPGWSVRIERRVLAHPLDTPDGTANTGIAKLVWTGGPITGARFERFTVRVGPLSGADTVVFKARQIYDSGRVERWEDSPSSSPTPNHPSPVLDVSTHAIARPADASDPVDSAFNLTEKHAIDSRVQSLIRQGQVASPDDVETGRFVALVALVVAFAALVFGVLAFLNTRRAGAGLRSPPTGDA
ncbi:MAG: DUF1775 domain-containing protein [Actinobacteria bacterium]|nr:DUF1775 domain-containing protein [Actinomycetota bacterium]